MRGQDVESTAAVVEHQVRQRRPRLPLDLFLKPSLHEELFSTGCNSKTVTAALNLWPHLADGVSSAFMVIDPVIFFLERSDSRPDLKRVVTKVRPRLRESETDLLLHPSAPSLPAFNCLKGWICTPN